jgi:hypothetical protein
MLLLESPPVVQSGREGHGPGVRHTPLQPSLEAVIATLRERVRMWGMGRLT